MLFSSTGITSSARIHLYLALFLHKDYFFRPDSSPACSFLPQGLLRPPGFILILLFFSAGIISAARIHLYLALLCRRDYFFCSDSSPACFFHHRDDFDRSDSSLSCSFLPQGLLRPPGFISILLFSTTGIIATARIHPQLAFFTTGITSSARMHPQLALFFHRDDFFRSDASLSCSFSPQGLLLPPGFIPRLLFCAAGMISSAQMHLYLALFHHRDYCDRPDSSLSCSFSPQGLLLLRRFISILLFCSAGIISSARIHPQLAFLCRRDDFFCADSSLSCSFPPQG